MKNLPLLRTLPTGLYSTSNAQTPADSAVALIRKVLKPGTHLVHYIRQNIKTRFRRL